MTDRPSLPSLVRTLLQRDPALPAIEFEERWFDWGEVQAVARDVMTALDASGIGDDAPVAFIPRNHPAAIAALLALLAQGRTVRMIYAFQSASGIARAIAAMDVAAVLSHSQDLWAEGRGAGQDRRLVGVVI